MVAAVCTHGGVAQVIVDPSEGANVLNVAVSNAAEVLNVQVGVGAVSGPQDTYRESFAVCSVAGAGVESTIITVGIQQTIDVGASNTYANLSISNKQSVPLFSGPLSVSLTDVAVAGARADVGGVLHMTAGAAAFTRVTIQGAWADVAAAFYLSGGHITLTDVIVETASFHSPSAILVAGDGAVTGTNVAFIGHGDAAVVVSAAGRTCVSRDTAPRTSNKRP